jgi:hypothetical protein
LSGEIAIETLFLGGAIETLFLGGALDLWSLFLGGALVLKSRLYFFRTYKLFSKKIQIWKIIKEGKKILYKNIKRRFYVTI